MNADMGGTVECRARRYCSRHGAVEFVTEFLLEQAEKLLDAQGIEHIFQPRLGAVGAVAVFDEQAHHRIRGLAGVVRPYQHAGVASEIAVPGDAAETELEPDAGLEAEAVVHLNRLEADVIGILEDGNATGAIEGEVELARQAVERTVVEDVEVPFARVGTRVDKLLRVDACGRRAGDVADIVGAGAARAQAEILDRLDHGDRIRRLHLADLDIGAGRHMRIAAAVALGEVGEAGELLSLDDPVRDAQPAHVGVLVGRDVEQTKESPAEIVGRLGIFALRRVLLQALVGVERMLLALELFLIGELAARREHAVLSVERRCVWTRWLRRRGGAWRSIGAAKALCRLGDLKAGDKSFQVAFLFGFEVAGRRRGHGLEIDLAHSAGTRVGAVRCAGAAARGLWVR